MFAIAEKDHTGRPSSIRSAPIEDTPLAPPDGEGLIDCLCTSLRETISAPFAFVVSTADRHDSGMIGATGGPTSEFSAEGCSTIPLSGDGYALGYLVIGGVSVTPSSCDWPVVVRHVELITRCLEHEVAWKRHEERLLAARVAVLRQIHDDVVQDLFGAALMLDDLAGRDVADIRACAESVRGALRELRSILDGATPDAAAMTPAAPPLPLLVERLATAAGGAALDLDLDAASCAPASVYAAVASFLVEGVRNAHKHADPSRVSVQATLEAGCLRVCVENDGVRDAHTCPGVGLRLLELDAHRLGGLLSTQRLEEKWRLTLTLPLATPR